MTRISRIYQVVRRISRRSASARLSSTRTTCYASGLHRGWSITPRTRLMRSQGCQWRASFTASRPYRRYRWTNLYGIAALFCTLSITHRC
jgi:hypothetical protein